MQQQNSLQNYESEQHQLGGNGGGGSTTPTTPAAPPPTPPPVQTAPAAPTAQQTSQTDQRLFAPQGFQSTVLSTDVNTSAGVNKKSVLGG